MAPLQTLLSSGEYRKPANLAWLDRFEICLEAECRESLGPDWRVRVDVPGKQILATRPTDSAFVVASLHPGMHVVKPLWAAHRIADQLHLSAVAGGLVKPPPGTSSAQA